MEDQDPLKTLFISSTGFTNPLEDIDNSQHIREEIKVGNKNRTNDPFNYGLVMSNLDHLGAGLLSSQDVAGSQSIQIPEADTNWSDFGSDFASEDEKAIDDFFEVYQTERREDSFAKKAAIQGSQLDDVAPFAKVPKPVSTQGSGSTSTFYSAIDIEGRVTSTVPVVQQGPSYYDFAKESEGEEGKGKTAVLKEGSEEVKSEEEQSVEKDADLPPLARFRKYRPLAVSDFVAPAWCELQYFYSLSKYGRIKRTAVMKKGTEAHKTLELEVHEYVPVEIQTKEDAWGLRIWNVVQGLRALRATGITRELDVWGVVDGEVVSGIIDEISTTCPDADLEAAYNASLETDMPPPDQRTITEFWGGTKSSIQDMPKVKYYLLDTKTRNTPTLPNEASLKQVKIQLMLYHHIIALLSTDQVQADVIFNRYNLNQNVPFSETFLAELAGLESDIDQNFGVTKLDDNTTPRNLQSLWNLMIAEFQQTFKGGTLAPILSASFRYQADGTHLGVKSFVHDEQHLQRHVTKVLKWWKGERPARGVEIEEAFKCRICEFAEDCEWRKEKAEEAKARRWKKGLATPS